MKYSTFLASALIMLASTSAFAHTTPMFVDIYNHTNSIIRGITLGYTYTGDDDFGNKILLKITGDDPILPNDKTQVVATTKLDTEGMSGFGNSDIYVGTYDSKGCHISIPTIINRYILDPNPDYSVSINSAPTATSVEGKYLCTAVALDDTHVSVRVEPYSPSFH